jgi:hypothetical protein
MKAHALKASSLSAREPRTAGRRRGGSVGASVFASVAREQANFFFHSQSAQPARLPLPQSQQFKSERNKKHMKRIMFSLLPAIFFWLGSCCTAAGQVAQSDQITDDKTGQTIQQDSVTNGKFPPVTVNPGGTSDVQLQFPTTAADKSVILQPLDGGTPSTYTTTIDSSGLLVFSFQVASQLGVSRVLVIDANPDADSPNIIGVVQFEVDPTQ